MSFLSKIEIEKALKPYLRLINEAIKEGWNFYYSDAYSPLAQLEHTKTTKANIIHNHIYAYFKREVSEFSEISNDKYYEFLIKSEANSFLIRFKKLKNKKSSNYPTKAALDFNFQQLKFKFSEEQKSIVCLNAGYEANDEITHDIEVYLCCPNGKSIDWFIDLSKYSQNVSQEPEKQVPEIIFPSNKKQGIVPKKTELPTVENQKKKRKKQKEA